MTCSYLPHTITRLIIFVIFVFAITNHREAMGDEIDSASTTLFGLMYILVIELSCYTNYKAMARLFVENKLNEKQQLQLE